MFKTTFVNTLRLFIVTYNAKPTSLRLLVFTHANVDEKDDDVTTIKMDESIYCHTFESCIIMHHDGSAFGSKSDGPC